jgi:hypothetical protein
MYVCSSVLQITDFILGKTTCFFLAHLHDFSVSQNISGTTAILNL